MEVLLRDLRWNMPVSIAHRTQQDTGLRVPVGNVVIKHVSSKSVPYTCIPELSKPVQLLD